MCEVNMFWFLIGLAQPGLGRFGFIYGLRTGRM